MKHIRHPLIPALIFLMIVSACNDRKSPLQPAPPRSPQPPAPAGVVYTLNVHVFASDLSDLVGATVEVVSGERAGAKCETGSAGICTLPGTFTETPSPEVRAVRDGFVPRTGRLERVFSEPMTLSLTLIPDKTAGERLTAKRSLDD